MHIKFWTALWKEKGLSRKQRKWSCKTTAKNHVLDKKKMCSITYRKVNKLT